MIGVKIKIIGVCLLLVILPSLSILLTKNKVSFNENKFLNCKNLNLADELRADCYAKELMNLPLAQVTSKMAAYEKMNIFKGKCHTVSHQVGRLVASRNTSSEAIKAKVDLNLCSQGILHGFLEETGKKSSIENLVDVAALLCNTEEGSGCIHGVGHAFAYAGISIEKTNQVCTLLTPKLRISTQGKNLPELKYNVNCIAGYIMQDSINTPSKYTNNSRETFNKTCSFTNKETSLGCNLGYFRLYAKEPTFDTKEKINFYKSQPADKINDEKLVEFKNYCSSLEASLKEECTLYLGMTFADVYSFARESNSVSSVLGKLCGLENLCYTGYFEIIISQLQSQSQAYFKDFCQSEICSINYKQIMKKSNS